MIVELKEGRKRGKWWGVSKVDGIHTARIRISVNLFDSAKPNAEEIPAAHEEVNLVVVLSQSMSVMYDIQ